MKVEATGLLIKSAVYIDIYIYAFISIMYVYTCMHFHPLHRQNVDHGTYVIGMFAHLSPRAWV